MTKKDLQSEKKRIAKLILFKIIIHLSHAKLSNEDLPIGLNVSSLVHFSNDASIRRIISKAALKQDDEKASAFFHEKASLLSNEKGYNYCALYNYIKNLLHDKGVYSDNISHDAGDPLCFLLANVILFDFDGRILEASDYCHLKALNYLEFPKEGKLSPGQKFMNTWHNTIFFDLMRLLGRGELYVKNNY